MDYFSKFRKHINPPKVPVTSAMQLAKFHKCWDYVHNIFIAEDRKLNLHVKQTEISENLRQMVDMLVDEEARQEDTTTGVCMEYFLKNGILHYLVSMSEKADYPEGIRSESIRTIASMVDLLDDRFLVHNAVHKPTIRLLRFCVLDERQSELDHEDLVDLMYIICSKIHGFPALLNIFFHDKQWLTTPQKTVFSAATISKQQQIPTTTTAENAAAAEAQQQQQQQQQPEYEFLLFTYLLRYVHLEGRSGDFARTGLLFLMEMATTGQLGTFILDSDFATIIVAGLGALYSQLPRKLIIKDENEINSSPASFLLGQDLDPRSFPSEELGVEQSDSEQFKYQLDSFLKPLEFCQDILLRCPNDAISERLLECIRKIFLENILDESILQCSDTDGSSVAVISYIDLILQTVQQQDLADVIVGYLMEEEDVTCGRGPKGRFYSLKDLIFENLESKSQPTVIATLKVLRTLITKHCRFASRLLSTDTERSSNLPSDDDTCSLPSTIISHHIREIELYFALVSAIDQVHAGDILTLGYENYLGDIEMSITHDACFQSTQLKPYDHHHHHHHHHHPTTPRSERRRSFKYGQKRISTTISEPEQDQHPIQTETRRQQQQQQRHCIRSTDKLIQILLSLLSNFFAQSSELNLALTGVISALAICPYRSLEGWMAFCESDRTNADDVLNLTSSPVTSSTIKASEIYALTAIQEQEKEQGQDDDQSIDFGVDRNSIHMTTPTQFKSFPPFYTLLRTLTQQINYYRNEIDGFDSLLHERWHGLLFGGAGAAAAGEFYPTPVPSLSSSVRSQVMTSPALSTSSVTSKLFGLGSTNGNSIHKRRSSISLKDSSVTNMTPPNPSKSLSSSTTAAAMGGSLTTPSSTTPSPPLKKPTLPAINPLSPLAIHVKKTLQMRIQPLFPSNFEIERDYEPILNLDQEDQDTFAAPFANPSQIRSRSKATEISTSMVLNNVVILEEMIKELVATMQVRRSLGVDKIRYT